MGKEKCRLCLCPTASQLGVPSSLMDESFDTLIKNVFRFVLPTFNIVAGKKIDLPDLVCFQCSNTIRNFHFFCEHVKANQKKLQEVVTYSTGTNGSEHASTRANNEERIREMDGNASPIESNESTLTEPEQCVAKVELVETLEKMDKRVDAVTKQLELLVQKLADNRPKKRSVAERDFDVTQVTTEQEVESFNQQLNDEEYKGKVQNWLNLNIFATDSDNRMHQTLDLIFHRAFLPAFSWTGKSKVGTRKLGLRNYSNIVELIQRTGNTDTASVTDRELEYFLQKKLGHAKDRINVLGTTSCHVDPSKRKKKIIKENF